MQNGAGLENKMKVAKIKYKVSKDGSVVGAIVVGANALPPGAIVARGTLHIDEAFTATGLATTALGIEAADDVLAATAKASLTLNAMLNIVPVGTAATQIKTTVWRGVTVTTAVDVLLTGGFTLFLEYYVL